MSKRILIIEDDRDILDGLKQILEMESYEVESAYDGEEALSLLRLSPGEYPDLILLDLMMAPMDGEVFRQEQLKDPDLAAIPTIVMTAAANITPIMERMHLESYIRKPYKVDEMLQLVANAI